MMDFEREKKLRVIIEADSGDYVTRFDQADFDINMPTAKTLGYLLSHAIHALQPVMMNGGPIDEILAAIKSEYLNVINGD